MSPVNLSHKILERLADALGVRPFELFMFEYFLPKSQMIREISEKMEDDDELAEKIYKYFLCVK